MGADGHLQRVSAGQGVTSLAASPPSGPSDATAEDESRRRAALRLRRLCDLQAEAGDPAGLRSTPAPILALFQ